MGPRPVAPFSRDGSSVVRQIKRTQGDTKCIPVKNENVHKDSFNTMGYDINQLRFSFTDYCKMAWAELFRS